MRVLLVSDFYPPHVGGVELQVQALGRALAQRGHVVHVACVSQPGLPAVTQDGAMTVHRLPAAATRVAWFSGNEQRRFHPPFPDPELAIHLRRLMAEIRPDAVQAHGWIAYSCALAGIGQGTPLVLSVRDYGYTCPTRNLLLNGRVCSGPGAAKCLRHATSWYGTPKGLVASLGVAIGRPILRRRVRAVHAVSRFVGEVVRRDLLGDAEREIAIISDIVLGATGTESSDSASAGAESVIERLPTRPFILFVGALQQHKGLSVLLAAYERLDDPPPLVLIGTTWPDTPSHFPEGVTLITDAPHAGVMAAWERALFGLAPSVWPDPLPGVVREAMIAGRPVVGSRVGGIVDMIVDGENGLLVEPGNADDLAGAMRRLIGDPELTARLGRQARDSVAEFGPDAIAAQFEALYCRLARIPGTDRQPIASPASLSPRRIHITGGSGNGKSWLAGRLSLGLGIPAHHLDQLARDPATGLRRSAEDRAAFVHEIAARPEWVTEGIHVGWTDELFREADLIVWLDHLDWRDAVARVFRRFVGGWVAETRRVGVRHLFRVRQYGRHLLDLGRAVRELRRYQTVEEAIADDAGSHRATFEQVAPYTSKLVHCRRPADIDALIAEVLSPRNAVGLVAPAAASGTRSGAR